MKRIIAVNSNSYHGFSLKEAVKGIKEAGFNYIELTATKGWTEHVFPTMSFNELWEVKELLIEKELIPISLSGHTNLMDQKRIDDFIANIRLANFFGCKYIVSSIGEAHLEDQAEASDEKVAENIKSLIPYLQRYDLRLALENHGKHGSGSDLKNIVELIDSKKVVINYDTANAIFYGDVDLKEDLKIALNKIGHFHLKDKAGEQREWNFPALGKGDIDFEPLFKLLKDNDNNSPFSIEIEFTEDGPKNLEEINKAVKDSAEYLKAKGFSL